MLGLVLSEVLNEDVLGRANPGDAGGCGSLFWLMAGFVLF